MRCQLLFSIFLLGSIVACAPLNSLDSTPTPSGEAMISQQVYRFTRGGQGRVGDIDIGIVAIKPQDYKEDDKGQTRRILSAWLSIFNNESKETKEALVIVGHEWDLYGCHFEVLDMREDEWIEMRIEPISPPCLTE